MKILYKINLILIITNIILGFTVYLGLLFMVITGVSQIIMYIIYLIKWENISRELKMHFIIYGILVLVIPFIVYLISRNLVHYRDTLINSFLFISAFLAFYFLYLSKKQKDFYELKIREQ